MALLIMDYQNAFPTLSHVFTHSVFAFMNLSEPIIQLIMQSLKGDYYFCVSHTVIKTSVRWPQAGIAQSNPLSTMLFFFCISIIFFALRKLDFLPRIYLYVDDSPLSFSVPHMAAMLEATLDILRQFSLVFGLHIHPGKSVFVVKGYVAEHTTSSASPTFTRISFHLTPGESQYTNYRKPRSMGGMLSHWHTPG